MTDDRTRGEKVIAFIELLVVPEGDKVGQPIVLEQFQKDFILAIYDNPDGTLEAFLSIARKNGKTALIACILLAHICGPEARLNSQVVSGARSRDQAALVWSLAAKIIDLTPGLSEICHVIPSSKKIIGLLMNVEYRALSADGAKNMGISPVLAVLDEVGQVVGPNDYFTDSITSSQGAYSDPLLIAISTQSPSDADLFSIWLDDAIRSGDKHVVCHLYQADEDADLLDESQWAKANPAIGKFLSVDYVRKKMEKSARLPSETNKAMNLHLNMRVSQESLWLSPKIWKENDKEPDIEVLRQGVHIGLDLSMRHDLTAAVLSAADDDGDVHMMTFAFSPLGAIDDRSRRDRVPYNQWARDGHIYAPPGDVLDYDLIAQYLNIKLEDLGIPIKSIQFDRYRINDFKAACERVGFALEAEWVEVGQGFVSFTPRIEHLESLLLQRKVRHGSHPVLNLGASVAIVEGDNAGNRRLTKKKSSQKIDGIVAAVMSAYPLMENHEEFNVAAWVG
jgi:phage terminase large subunit-like protein